MSASDERAFEVVVLAAAFRDPRGRAFVAENFPESVVDLYDAVIARPEWATASDLTAQALVVAWSLDDDEALAARYRADVDAGRLGFGAGDGEMDAAIRDVADALEPRAAPALPDAGFAPGDPGPVAAEPPAEADLAEPPEELAPIEDAPLIDAGPMKMAPVEEEERPRLEPGQAEQIELQQRLQQQEEQGREALDEHEAHRSPAADDDGGLLGGDGEDHPWQPGAPGGSPAADPADAIRTHLNADLDNGADPLQVGKTYQLAVSIGKPTSTTPAGSPEIFVPIRPGDATTDLTIEVVSSDFSVPPFSQQLRVGRDGASVGRALFEVVPLAKEAAAPGAKPVVWILSVIVTVKGNWLQRLDLTYDVGGDSAAADVAAYGRTLGSADALQERVATLQFKPMDWGYELIALQSPSTTPQRVQVSPLELDNRITDVRNVLLDAVRKDPVALEMKITDADNAALLAPLAEAGYRLFQLIFEDMATDELLAIGDWLRTTIAGDVTTLQVVSDGFPVPWPLMYVTERWDPDALSWHNFIGMQCVVEQVPLTRITAVPPPTIVSTPELSVRALFNDSIDEKMPSKPTAEQRRYWGKAGVALTAGASVDDLIHGALGRDSTDKVLYLYCHAESSGKDTDASKLILTGSESVTLGKLKLDSPRRDQLAGHPLVFINACESGQLTPEFYGGFVPYFLSKGARGVIGTECKTPGLFASEWAKAFFDELFTGKALGQVVLELRRKFLDDYNNPLGLLYGVHCDTDTVVSPALPRPVV